MTLHIIRASNRGFGAQVTWLSAGALLTLHVGSSVWFIGVGRRVA